MDSGDLGDLWYGKLFAIYNLKQLISLISKKNDDF